MWPLRDLRGQRRTAGGRRLLRACVPAWWRSPKTRSWTKRIHGCSRTTIALLKTYGLGPYSTSIKKVEKETKEISNKINDLCANSNSFSGHSGGREVAEASVTTFSVLGFCDVYIGAILVLTVALFLVACILTSSERESTGWIQKEDGAMENVGSLLDLGTAAAAHFCRSS